MSCYYAELLHHSMMIHLIICVHIIVQYYYIFLPFVYIHTLDEKYLTFEYM